jgi:hypothetical protein
MSLHNSAGPLSLLYCLICLGHAEPSDGPTLGRLRGRQAAAAAAAAASSVLEICESEFCTDMLTLPVAAECRLLV